MMTRVKNRPALMTALAVAALGLAACDDAQWLIAQAKKGAASPDSSGGTKPDPLPPPPTECKTASQGDPTSCKDAGTWKKYAYDACVAVGATLGDYSPYEDCGNGNTRYVKYTCCPAVPPPPPPPTECKSASQGDPTSCKDAGTWKKYAYDACVAVGATLGDYSPYEDCGNGNTRYVKYTCCPAVPPPPPPPTDCTIALQGDPTSCKDVGTWKTYAYEACVAAGATLTDYSTNEDCGNGNTRYVKYTCCSPKAPPPVK